MYIIRGAEKAIPVHGQILYHLKWLRFMLSSGVISKILSFCRTAICPLRIHVLWTSWYVTAIVSTSTLTDTSLITQPHQLYWKLITFLNQSGKYFINRSSGYEVDNITYYVLGTIQLHVKKQFWHW